MQVSTQKTLINQAEHQRKIAHINFLLCLLWYNVEHSDTKEITLNAIVAKDPSARFILIRCTVTSYPTHKEITVSCILARTDTCVILRQGSSIDYFLNASRDITSMYYVF